MNATQGHASRVPEERATILLVEDDPGVRRSLQLLLQARGYLVRAFASGIDLLADPASVKAACLVADYRLDGLDGLAVQRQLRARGWRGGAILITAFNDKDLAEQARAEGFSDVIDKPLLERALSGAVARLVGAAPDR